ncbi:rubrerythrin [Viridibacterium curvum]|uniref:Ferritin family protein n=1 Tax=Viridibacterium curvum TaxID=1101404 RepID=A0ABP9R512_9RHOO
MNEIQLFLSHAIQLEREAAERYQELHAAMTEAGHGEASAFFGTMAVFAHKHLDEAVAMGGSHALPELDPNAFRWFGGVSPEAPDLESLSSMVDLQTALLMALQGEHRSHVFYRQVSELSQDPEVRRVAGEFAAEEAEHVAALQQWLARTPVKA